MVDQGPEGDAFYDPPAALVAGEPGTLVWARPIPAPAGATGWQILYRSTSATGTPIPVSGVLYAPSAPAEGARDILAWAHGTTGLGDQCTPSKEAAEGKGNELLLANLALAKGLAFVYTDYEGLGTPGVHTYVVGRSEGQTVLDSIRAAQRLPGAGTSPASKAVVWGHSQGGGAALWAAELQPTYAPELAVVGSIAGAPAVELITFGQRLRTSPFFGYQLMAVAGFHAAYPDLPLETILTPDGVAAVTKAGTQCGGETVAELRGQDQARYFLPGADSSSPWAEAFTANTPGGATTSVPIFIYHGDQDEQVPVDLSATAAEKYCANGTTVQRKVYPGANHTSVIQAAVLDINGYLEARLAGDPVPSTC